MKRKIAAILAADIAGYSRLVAEDEEETLRRLASYRSVIDDFIAKAGGRIFNTAGDAVLAEFPSAVEAVRCAIDVQESLRTRNMAYPPSRQMSFRIGITIGDVVERDGDLLGDGVNIAARLEGLAEAGGICVSRAVHEQVANKLSVQFADIGAQEVKNIPTPVHAYLVAMRREDGTYATPQLKKTVTAPPPRAAAPAWMWPLVVAVVCLAAIGVSGFLYFTKLEIGASSSLSASSSATPAPASSPSPAKSVPSPTPSEAASASPLATPSSSATPVATSTPAVAASALSPSSSVSSSSSGEKLVAGAVPFVANRVHQILANDYLPATDYKAIALNMNGIFAMVSGQPSEQAARSAAIEQCQKRVEPMRQRPCEVYAVGNSVVYAHGRPPLPALPWVKHDSLTERPFAVKDMPLVRDPGRNRLEEIYVPGHASKSIALGPGGQFFFNVGIESIEETVRRNLESCGAVAGVACIVVAVNDTFVVPVPAIMKVTGFFHAAAYPSIAVNAREDVERQLADASPGWNAVAVGTAGRPGLGLKAANEQAAINDALANCAKHDSDCHVIAIGPFAVGPN